ncbi:MAG: rRNA pseudouridine synthase [Lentisphaerae bacterium]|nr:MAG: rRNA pseudouridine synthase [Lentisphaerota bacterium]
MESSIENGGYPISFFVWKEKFCPFQRRGRFGQAQISVYGVSMSSKHDNHSQASRIRLNRFLAMAGLGSRRGCEQLIRRREVFVNGVPAEHPGMLVHPEQDEVKWQGRVIRPLARRYLVLYKPPGYTCSLADPFAEHLIHELYSQYADAGLFPVGRLDRESEGLLLVTNDGDFAHYIMHPRHQVEKEYHVQIVNAPPRLIEEGMARIRKGIRDEGEFLKPREIALLREEHSTCWLRMILNEGKKREIRRLCKAVGWVLTRLVRVRIGNLEVGDLQPGTYRELSAQDLTRYFGWAPDNGR